VLGFVYLAIGTLLWLVLALVQSASIVSWTGPGACFVVAIIFFVAHLRLTTPRVRISTRGSTAQKLKSIAAIAAIAAPLLAVPINILAVKLTGQTGPPAITEIECRAPGVGGRPNRNGGQLN
jgi:hypothetical protein